MPHRQPDPNHLVALIAAAGEEARRHGPAGAGAAAALDQALRAARALAARGGDPDEGLRPDELTTDNDR